MSYHGATQGGRSKAPALGMTASMSRFSSGPASKARFPFPHVVPMQSAFFPQLTLPSPIFRSLRRTQRPQPPPRPPASAAAASAAASNPPPPRPPARRSPAGCSRPTTPPALTPSCSSRETPRESGCALSLSFYPMRTITCPPLGATHLSRPSLPAR